VDVTTPLGPLGPWLFEATRTGSAYTFRVSFNQARQVSFGLDITGWDGATKIDLRAPRATPADLGAKPDMFGATPADVVKIDASSHIERKGTGWTGTLSGGVEGFHLPGAHPATLALDLAF